jgi:hypothetical protein
VKKTGVQSRHRTTDKNINTEQGCSMNNTSKTKSVSIWRTLSIWIALFACALAAGAQTNVVIPPAAEILKSLRKEHPRLFANADGFAALKKRVAADAQLKSWHEQLRKEAEKILSEPPSKYEIPDGLRLLFTSRRVVQRVQTLGLLYRLDGDKRYVERAWQELEAAANFQDWNPRHFLDTAEMTHAFGLGYDWFFDAWTPDQRQVIRTAIIEKGLKPALNVHHGNPKPSSPWNKLRHNWNQVCNGGISIGALAIADEEPALASELLSDGLNSIQLAMAEFAPDGAWAEGPGYWNYATTYNVALLAAVESALGTDFGLAKIPGFAGCGTFPIYVTGPLGKTFNYADGGDGTIRAPHMFWLAKKFQRPEYAAYQNAVISAPQPLDLLWFDRTLAENKSPSALNKYFRNAEVVTMRSAWNDRDAVFVGFKGGDNKANHSNLDLGSFVLDADGVRWFVDLGADDYNLPGYFGNQRWTYYRMRAEGHNALVLNPTNQPDQNPRAAAKIIRFDSKPERVFAIADLTAAYASDATQVRRGIAIMDRKRTMVQDEFKCAKPSDVWWFAHTPAQVTVGSGGRIATLSQSGKKLVAKILSPTGATFRVMDAAPLPESPHPTKQNANKGIHKLAIHLEKVTDARLCIAFEEDGLPLADSAKFKAAPLDKW